MRLATCGIGPKDAGKCPATICIRSLQDLNASASLFAAAPSAKRLSIPLTQEKARPYAPSGIKKHSRRVRTHADCTVYERAGNGLGFCL